MVDINELLEQQRKASKMKIIARDYSMATQSYDIFLSGCRMGKHCPGCHNSEAWSFDVGTPWIGHILQINKDLQQFGGCIKRIFILGGEPLDQDPDEFSLFIAGLKEFNKELWLFTRYELEDIPEVTRQQFDYIKTGPYKEELSVDNYICDGIKLATENQKVLKRERDY